MRRSWASVLVLLASALVTSNAGAQELADISAAVVIDSGTTDLFVESLVRTTAEGELTKRGYRIVEGAAVGGETPAKLLACSGDLNCAVAILSGIGAKHVIFLSLRTDEESATNFKIVARNFEVATGKALARTAQRCQFCTEEVDLAAFTESVITELLKEPDEPVSPVPAPPVTPVAPPVNVAPPSVVSPPVHNSGSVDSDSGLDYSAGIKYLGLGAGIAAIATGTVLVLIDGPVIDNGVRQPEAYDTLTAGYVSLASGAALVGLSAWLWSIESEDESSALVVAPSAGAGGSVTWMGRF